MQPYSWEAIVWVRQACVLVTQPSGKAKWKLSNEPWPKEFSERTRVWNEP